MSATCAAPSHGASGELIDGGADLGQSGFTGYYFDAIYICIAVQLATLLSDWFWLLFLSVRACFCPYQRLAGVGRTYIPVLTVRPVLAGPSIWFLQTVWRSHQALAICATCTTGAREITCLQTDRTVRAATYAMAVSAVCCRISRKQSWIGRNGNEPRGEQKGDGCDDMPFAVNA